MIPRLSEKTLLKYASQFPVVILTGARQVGKTTLLRECFQDYQYVLLEDPDLRAQAQTDVKTFLQRYSAPVIFDEFQNVPELTSYLQGEVDKNRSKTGQYLLTGSQNFLMMEQVSQSLAGRAGILSLYGLSISEIEKNQRVFAQERRIAELIWRGTFPELWQKENLDPVLWQGSYLRTYIERDVRNLAQVGDIQVYERFVRLLAIRTGQLLNLSDLARDCGISHTTARRWLSILQETYQVYLLQPFYENLSSRIKKSPKVYFLDTGLASYLMGFKTPEQILGAPQFGALFETLVITNFIKTFASYGEIPEHYFIQTQTGEVDLMIRNQMKWDLYEIKYNRTIKPTQTKQLHKMKKLLGDRVQSLHLLVPIEESFELQDVTVRPYYSLTPLSF